MPVRIVEGQKPYTAGPGIDIDANKVISLLLREENNLIYINDNDEAYVDLQLQSGLTPNSDFPVGVTVGKVLQSDGWTKSGLVLNRKTTSGDYARWIYATDGELYFDKGTGVRNQVYYSSEVDALLAELDAKIDALADSIGDGQLTIQKNSTTVGTFTANQSGDTVVDIEVPLVIDNLTSTDTTNALSAYQGRVLKDMISSASGGLGRFLSLWNSSTGMPISFPLSIPYTYGTGDWFLVEVTGTNNYMPTGSSYTGTASTVVDTNTVEKGDVYIYDGNEWLLQKNTAVEVSFSNITGQPSDNTALASALNAKANDSAVVKLTGNQTVAGVKTFNSSPSVPTPTNNSDAATKKYVDDTASSSASGKVSDTAYASSWNGVTGVAPSKNAVYDKISAMDTTIAGKADSSSLATVATSGSYNDLSNKPTIPTVNNGTLTINQNGTSKGTFTANQSGSSTINLTDTTYNAGEGIEIGNVSDYSAMQGPAPTGYHVPLNTEWQAVKDIWTALGGGSTDGTNFGIALKLPFAGRRYGSSASVNGQGTDGRYWSSPRYNANYAYNLNFGSATLNPQNTLNITSGFSVRCFKNSPIIPTSSWTKLYGTSIEAGGIFRGSTDGLISLSSDGQTWITISDKNLGATTVWNSGDTLSEANCGYYYQRGNNYGFPRTGTVTTSSTQVDASSYGPGNYYSSSTYITGSNDWSSVRNDNLWGGVTGVVTLNNAISNTGVTSVNGNTGDVTVAEFKATNGGVKIFDMPSVNGDMAAIVEWLTGGGDVILRTISSNVETYYTVIEWDGTNRTIKAENSDGDTVVVYTITYNASGTCTAVTNQSYSGGGDAKVFEISDLTSAASLATATQAYTYAYTNKKCAIIRYSGSIFVYSFGNPSRAYFHKTISYGDVSSGTWALMETLQLTVSSGNVTAIAQNINQIVISTTEPASGTSNGTITLVI